MNCVNISMQTNETNDILKKKKKKYQKLLYRRKNKIYCDLEIQTNHLSLQTKKKYTDCHSGRSQCEKIKVSKYLKIFENWAKRLKCDKFTHHYCNAWKTKASCRMIGKIKFEIHGLLWISNFVFSNNYPDKCIIKIKIRKCWTIKTCHLISSGEKKKHHR